MQILAESLTIPGSVFEEHEIPSDPALVTPVVVRLTDKLVELGWLSRKNKGRIQLCLDEAITNSIVHGNKKNFDKMVHIRLWRDTDGWGIAITDEGEGFALEDLTPPAADRESLWNEDGRGLALMTLYMDEVTYYDNGCTLLLKQRFES